MDVVVIENGASFGGSIDGGSDTNTIDFSDWSTSVAVDLSQGTATGVAGVSNIQDIVGGGGSDVLTGDANDNVIIGGAWQAGLGVVDTIDGQAGTDTISYAGFSSIGILVDLSKTTDTVEYQDSPNQTIANVSNVENVIGGAMADTITGSSAANVITGGGGNDILAGGDGDDTFVFAGDWGVDTLTDSDGQDGLDFSAVSANLSFDIGRTPLPSESPTVAADAVDLATAIGRGISVTDDATVPNSVTTDFSVEDFTGSTGTNTYSQANTLLTVAQQDSMLAGLANLKAWADALDWTTGEAADLLNLTLPLVSQSVSDILSPFDVTTGIGAKIQSEIIDPLTDFFMNDPSTGNPRTSAERAATEYRWSVGVNGQQFAGDFLGHTKHVIVRIRCRSGSV